MEKVNLYKTKRNVLTALLSTSVFLAGAPLPIAAANAHSHAHALETNSQDGFRNILLDSSSLTFTLAVIPATVPSEEDFSIQLSQNGKPLSLKKDSFRWDQETGTAQFFFKPVAATKQEQTIAATIRYSDSHAQISTVFAPKGEEISELELVNLSDDNRLSLQSNPDKTLTLRAVPKDSKGRLVLRSKVQWESSNEDVAIVDKNGFVTAVGEGKAEIIASAGDISARYVVKIDAGESVDVSAFYAANGLAALQLPQPLEAEPNPADFALYVRENGRENLVKLPVSAVDWVKESDTVRIKFSPQKPRTEEVNYTIRLEYNGADYEDSFTLASQESKVSRMQIVNLSGDEVIFTDAMGDGQALLYAEPLDDAGNLVSIGKGKVKWRSQDKRIATVDQNGLVTAIKPGETSIFASVGGKKAVYRMVVKESGLRLHLDKQSVTEEDTDNGAFQETITVTLEGGRFDRKLTSNDVTIEHLPDGLQPSVKLLSKDKLLLGFSGRAATHEVKDNRDDLQIVINARKIIGKNGDPLANVASAPFSVRFVDETTPPVIRGIEDGKLYNGEVIPVSPSTDLAQVILKKDGVLVNGYKLGQPISEEGSYQLELFDTNGNQTVVRFAIDKSAPIVQGVENGQYYHPGIIPTSPSTDIASTVLKRDGQVVPGFTLGTMLVDIGNYELSVTDQSGHTTTISFVVFPMSPIDRTPPVIQNVTDGGVYRDQIVTPFSPDHDIKSTILTKDGVPVPGYVLGNPLSEEGSYQLKVTDRAGNSTTVSFQLTKSFHIELTGKKLFINSGQNNEEDNITLANPGEPFNYGKQDLNELIRVVGEDGTQMRLAYDGNLLAYSVFNGNEAVGTIDIETPNMDKFSIVKNSNVVVIKPQDALQEDSVVQIVANLKVQGQSIDREQIPLHLDETPPTAMQTPTYENSAITVEMAEPVVVSGSAPFRLQFSSLGDFTDVQEVSSSDYTLSISDNLVTITLLDTLKNTFQAK
ncbi:MAG: Ig-like domain-containing protein, partial [Clostridia bacterium]